MKIVKVLEKIGEFREKLEALDDTYSNSDAFDNKLSESELEDFLNNIEDLSSTGVFNSTLLSEIEDLAGNDSLRKAVKFKRLDLSDLNMDENNPDNGDVEDTIDSKSEYAYEEIRREAEGVIQELSSKLKQLLLVLEV